VSKKIWLSGLFSIVLFVAAVFLRPQGQLSGGAQMPPAASDAPVTTQLTHSPEEQDYPAIAQSGDTVYLCYVEFVHSNRELEIKKFDTPPKDLDFLARPAGGDQVFLMTYSKSNRAWGQPEPVSAAGQDILRAAVAVDGHGRVWVFWSANKNNNFDIYAKAMTGGKWSEELRLTSDPGMDVNPVAATDAQGRVWVAWQAFRNDNLEILAAAQSGDQFTKETKVSFSPRSDWDPAIATAPNGEVAVSWDTYDKGDYDVYFRRLRMKGSVQMDAPIPVAASQNFEARSSIAYDRDNRLWVAYEASATKWGKDFGAYETTGVSLYQDHNVRVKCFRGNEAFETSANLPDVISGPARATPKKQQNASPTTLPDAETAKLRKPNGNAAIANQMPLNSFPRIAAGPGGTIFLAYRKPYPGTSLLGLCWTQELVYFDGASWQGPIGIPHTDNYLDVRPALAAIAPGDLLMIEATDHRLQPGQAAAPKAAKKKKQQAKKKAAAGASEGGLAAVKVDLYAAEVRVNPQPASARLKRISAEKVASPDRDVKPERDQIQLMRSHRLTLGSERLQLLRGEFHRHTEMSGHGIDGPLIDAYRYMIDAASMDWGGCCDHDNGGGREYNWWTQQKLTDAYHLGTSYTSMFVYERSVAYPEGHRNVVNPKRGIRTLPRLPIMKPDSPPTSAPDTEMLYRYLKQFGGIVASHTSGTNMGTDWRNNDPLLEPVVEIYQGDRQNYEMPGAPRTNSAGDSIGGWRALGFVSLALQKGYRLGFQASSDHTSTHMSYCNLWVTGPTREAVMDAFRKRRVYGATDNILADVRCGSHFMGEEFTTAEAPSIAVKLWGMDKFAKVHIIKDGQYVYSAAPNTKNVSFVWKDGAAEKGKTSYYYVRGEQADGELVWVSPMWITYK
jgi:hypothetical protein